MEPSLLTQQGIAAYKAGNKEEAVRLLGEAIRANRQDEQAWLYLGVALDDPARKRQAFNYVLAINPNSDRAKNALARLDMATQVNPPPAAQAQSTADSSAKASTESNTGAQASAPLDSLGTSFNEAWSGKRSFKLPFTVAGAPDTVTIPLLMESARMRIGQAADILMQQNFDLIISAGEFATLWDSVFVAGLGIVILGAADFVGRLIGWPISGFYGGLGGLLWAIFAPILLMLSVTAGYIGGMYASKAYLEGQHVPVSLERHNMYYAMIFLPLMLINAAATFVTHALPNSILNFILFVVIVVAVIYSIWLLKTAFDRVYGSDDNRGLLTAVIAIAGWVVGSVVGGIIAGVFGVILGALFHASFGLFS